MPAAAVGRLAPEVVGVWWPVRVRPERRSPFRMLSSPWVLSAVGVALASYVGTRLWRRI